MPGRNAPLCSICRFKQRKTHRLIKHLLQIYAHRPCTSSALRAGVQLRKPRMRQPQRATTTYRGSEPGFRACSLAHEAKGNASTKPLPKKPENIRDQFCRMCGTQMQMQIPKGESVWRHMCGNCGYIDYLNPKTVRMGFCHPCLPSLSHVV